MNNKINLINKNKSSRDDVVLSLLKLKNKSAWEEKTNHYSVEYVDRLTKTYGNVWYYGNLPQEFFLDILLPKHGHTEEKNIDILLFDVDTSVRDAIEYFKNVNPNYSKDCLSLIGYLKEEIRNKGFISEIVLYVVDGKLKHVDGLHRMIALGLLLEEGYKYEPIPVFLCDPRV